LKKREFAKCWILQLRVTSGLVIYMIVCLVDVRIVEF